MILNRQRTVRVARPPLEIFLRRVREHLGLTGAELTICMVSDAEITRLNESYRKKQGPTDVLSFPAVTRRKPVAVPRRHSANQKRQAVVAAAFRAGRLLAPSPTNKASSRRRLLPTSPNKTGSPFRHGTASARPERRRVMPKQTIEAKALAPEADFLGDIAISPATARRNARTFHRTLPQELQILILHGVLHLLGYDHETDRGQMTRVENRLRRKLGLA
jgi:rRNA maturation RNase YbeY